MKYFYLDKKHAENNEAVICAVSDVKLDISKDLIEIYADNIPYSIVYDMESNKLLNTIEYVYDGMLSSGYKLPDGAELYNEDEWYFNGEKYLKKDDSYNIWLKKQEILQELAYVDSSVTSRTMREATLGDPIAIEIIRSAEERATELRKKLGELA